MRRKRLAPLTDTRTIYCGDNLGKLESLPPACVDLIYIDPPFNSNRNYEVFWGETKETRAFEDRHESTKAYIEFMRPRCVELARVLKKTGSFYYHCDWHASHYVKVMLDQIFGESNFQNEIIWKRTSAHSSAQRYGPIHDTLLFFTGSEAYTWNQHYQPFNKTYLDEFYTHFDADGRRWQRSDLTGDGIRHGDSGKPWKGIDVTAKGRHWAVPGDACERLKITGDTVQDRLDALDEAGLIHWPKKDDGIPRFKRYADEMPGVPLQTVWDDISPLHNLSKEREGYPTQKPLALLERVIKASSKPGDVVLDAFCGCGTALIAAQKLDREWIGMDVSPTACRVMAQRLKKVCKLHEGTDFHVRDMPRSIKQLHAMPHFEFENWAVIAIGGIPNKAQVGDMGIDGKIFPVSAVPKKKESDKEYFADFMDAWYPIQVKQKDKAGRPDIDAFEAVMMREERTKGFFVSFDFTSDAKTEIRKFYKRSGRAIVALTVQEILDEEIAMKMA